jgi:hypothetical protein
MRAAPAQFVVAAQIKRTTAMGCTLAKTAIGRLQHVTGHFDPLLNDRCNGYGRIKPDSIYRIMS